MILIFLKYLACLLIWRCWRRLSKKCSFFHGKLCHCFQRGSYIFICKKSEVLGAFGSGEKYHFSLINKLTGQLFFSCQRTSTFFKIVSFRMEAEEHLKFIVSRSHAGNIRQQVLYSSHQKTITISKPICLAHFAFIFFNVPFIFPFLRL